MKKELNGVKSIVSNAKVKEGMMKVIQQWGIGTGDCAILFGELPFPQEAYEKLKKQEAENLK